MKRFASIVLAALLAAGSVTAQDLERLFKAAVNTETVDRNCRAAIEQYQKVVTGNNRALAAQALLRMAGCYQNLGDPEAQETYQRIIDDYPEQKVAVSTAKRNLEPARAVGSTSRVLSRLTLDAQSHVSRDGRWLPLIDWNTNALILRDLRSGQDTQLTNTGVRGPVGQQYPGYSRVSPDGKTIAFSWLNGERYEIRLLDIDPPGRAQPVTLYQNSDIPYLQPFAWSPDGKYLAVGLERVDRTGQVALLSVKDGILQPLESFAWRGEMSGMAFSPDGKWLAYDLPAEDDAGQHDVFVLAMDRHQKSTITAHRRDDKLVTWSPDGAYVLFSSDRTGARQLWAQRMDGGKAVGAPRSVTADFGSFAGISADGAMYDVLTTRTSSLFRIVDFDFTTGRATSTPVDPGEEYFSANGSAQAAWSADGRQLLLNRRIGGDPLGQTFAIINTDGSKVREVRPQLHGYGPFVWSRDGRSLYAPGEELKGRHGIVQIDSITGIARVIAADDSSTPGPLTVVGDSPDGGAIYYGRLEGKPGAGFGGIALHLFERNMNSGAEREITSLKGDGQEHVPDFWYPQLSPDGRHIIAGESAPGGRMLTVIDVATGERRVTSSAGSFMMWTPDSRSVFAEERSSGRPPRVVRVWIDSGKSEAVDWNLGYEGRNFRPHPDGRRLVYVIRNAPSQSQLRKITGVFGQLAASR
jgi:Tol biopolymer transport system component